MGRFFVNLLRSAGKNWASWVGAVLIIALGVLSYIGSLDVYYNLRSQIERFYSAAHYADVFASVTAMPQQELESLTEIEGVEQVFGRLAVDARLVREEASQIVQVHLLAVTGSDTLNQAVADVSLDSLGDDTLLIGTKMAQHYALELGDTLELIYGGELWHYTYGGEVKSPEYIYIAPTTSTIMPDNEVYDIAALSPQALEDMTGMEGMVTELSFTLSPGYELENVRQALEDALDRYGLLSLNGRDDQTSNALLETDMGQLAAMAAILPALFLGISIIMLYIVLRKMIEKDRTLIGTMKAFGAGDGELLRMYLKQGAVLGVVGGLAAAVLAIPLSQALYSLYTYMFSLPYDDFTYYPATRLIGLAMSLVTSLIATLVGVRGILSIHPAESMRAATPEVKGRFRLPALLDKLLNTRQKLGLRSIFRNPLRSAVIALAVAFPFAAVAALTSVDGVVAQLFWDQQTKVQTYDLKADLDSYVSYHDAVSAGRDLEHVYQVEAIATYSVRVACANRSEYTMLTALNPGSTLYRIMAADGTYYQPPDDGVLLSSSLASKLGAETGDLVEVEIPRLSAQPVTLPVVGVVEETFSGGCYLSPDAVSRIFSAPKAANAILFKVDAGYLEQVKQELMDTSRVTAVTDTQKILDRYEERMGSMLAVVRIFVFMSLIAGMVLIYNISGISLRERRNEFGTLMVLGMHNRELSEIVRFEQGLNFLVGIIGGFPLTAFFAWIVESVISSDSYTVHLAVTGREYALAFAACVAVEVVSLLLLAREIYRIHPGDVLKERE